MYTADKFFRAKNSLYPVFGRLWCVSSDVICVFFPAKEEIDLSLHTLLVLKSLIIFECSCFCRLPWGLGWLSMICKRAELRSNNKSSSFGGVESDGK